MQFDFNSIKVELSRNKFRLVRSICTIVLLSLLSIYVGNKNYLLFHTIIQLITSFIAFSVLITAVNTYNISKNNFFMFLGIGYFFVAIFDTIHTMTYPGIGIFKGVNLNISYQAVIIATYIESMTILFSYKLLKSRSKGFKPLTVAAIVFLAAVFVIFSIFYKNLFPNVVNKANNPTLFRYISEYIVLSIFVVASVLFYRIRKNVDNYLFVYIESIIAAKVVALLIFIFMTPHAVAEVFLHVAKLIAYYYVYKAVVETGITSPYKQLYHELAETNGKLVHENEIRKSIEEAFLNNEECYKLLIEKSKDSIVVHSGERFIFANDQALKMIKLESMNDIIGKSIYDFVHEDQREKIKDKLYEVYDKKSIMPFLETKIEDSNGEEINVDTASAYFIYKGKAAVMTILVDIGYKKQVEELKKDVVESTKLLMESREYNKLITEFISNISHELRTPLNVILSAVQLLNMPNSEMENKKDKYLGIMKQNSFRLLKLINNIIDISKIDSGYLELNMQSCNIIDVIENIVLSVAEYIENKGVCLIFDTEVEEKFMACDFDKIERIMLNLLSNSVKFTKAGDSIFVYVEDEGETIKIHVKDTGIGIPEDKLGIIFQRFRQVDKSFTRNHEGSGIGLALVKSLVEMHQGTIEVKSVVGHGSEFIITLPVLESNGITIQDQLTHSGNVESISIEFSDIYS